MNGNRFYDLAVKIVSVFFIVIGAIIFGITIVNGGGPLSVGVLIGLAFVGIGVARWRLQNSIGGSGQ
ncbi:MAG: hypothetical protein WBP55_03360 [Solirubrobacterales bacterium]